MKSLEKVTITSILVSTSLYILMSFMASTGESFPFLIGAAFLIATAIAAILSAVSVSVWVFRRARDSNAQGALIGAWISTVGVIVAVGTILFQLFRGGGFWVSLFNDLLWAVATATALLWLGFALLVLFARRC